MVKKKSGENQNLLGILSYLFGPAPILGQVVAIFLLMTNKKNSFVRFHAMQSLIFFCAVLVISFILTMSLIGLILIPFLLIAEFVLWILFMWKALNGELFKFPLIGAFAEKQLKKIK